MPGPNTHYDTIPLRHTQKENRSLEEEEEEEEEEKIMRERESSLVCLSHGIHALGAKPSTTTSSD
jgi:hypothetical protein